MSLLRGTSRRKRLAAMLFATSAAVSTLLPAAPAVAHSYTHECQCVDYIKHYYGITGPTGNAKDMGYALTHTYGFRRVYSPVVGAVVIFQPAFGNVNAKYGHVSRIRSFSEVNSGRDWKLNVRSANYGSPTFTANRCTNMRDHGMHSYPKGYWAVSYYVR